MRSKSVTLTHIITRGIQQEIDVKAKVCEEVRAGTAIYLPGWFIRADATTKELWLDENTRGKKIERAYFHGRYQELCEDEFINHLVRAEVTNAYEVPHLVFIETQ